MAVTGCGRKIGPFDCCSVVQGDCSELLPLVVDGTVDAVITDPPYGIRADVAQSKRAGTQYGKSLAPCKDYGATDWDYKPSDELIQRLTVKAKRVVIFGGNYFPLPPSRCWLVWDKQNGENEYADCELAWTNLDKAVRRIYWQWHGFIRVGKEERYHPTQKPSGVMEWCIQQAGFPQTVLDPFAGSGTTLVAAKKSGCHFLGFEISPEYCDIARRRLAEIDAQPVLFAPQPEQLTL